MSLFNKRILQSVPFDKERIKEEILREAPLKAPLWTLFPADQLGLPKDRNQLDFLCIRSISVNKEIRVTANPFSSYKRVEPCVYQIVGAVYISNEEVGNNTDWRVFVVTSAPQLFRMLDETL